MTTVTPTNGFLSFVLFYCIKYKRSFNSQNEDVELEKIYLDECFGSVPLFALHSSSCYVIECLSFQGMVIGLTDEAAGGGEWVIHSLDGDPLI